MYFIRLTYNNLHVFAMELHSDLKAYNYDRVNHWVLFKKLLKRSISVITIRILIFWYSKQEICIKWGNETSTCFTISNGVRQGGILIVTHIVFYLHG